MDGADEFTALNLLNNERTDWKICVKVFVTWKKTYYNNPSSAMSLELIFVDNQGNKIRGSVRKGMIPYVENTFKEGNCLHMSDFGVVPCDDIVRIVVNDYKLNIYRTTKVDRCGSFDMANDCFQIVPFDHICEWSINSAAVDRKLKVKELTVNGTSKIDSEVTTNKVKEDTDNGYICNTLSTVGHMTPHSDSIKRKSESPPDAIYLETSTTGKSDGIAYLKTPRLHSF